jgi:hypothetical protein
MKKMKINEENDIEIISEIMAVKINIMKIINKRNREIMK